MEYKFRAWAEITIKQWVAENGAFKKEYRMLPIHSIHFGTEKVMISSEFGVRSLPFSKVTIMQFTGLKDKTGKKIYEGDIIRTSDKSSIYHEMPEEIKWDDGGFKLIRISGGYWERLHGLIAENCEVIGNIYENPELLTGKEQK